MYKVTFLVTNGCNFKCKHCFVRAGELSENEMSYEEKLLAIDKLKDLGVKKITFSGGEPLLDPSIFDYITRVKKLGLEVGFLTNAWLLNDIKINFLMKNVNSLSISLYTNDILGLPQKLYDKYFNNVIDVFKKMTDAGFEFKITFPISSKNQEMLEVLIKLLYDNQIKPKMVRIYMITPVGRGNDNRYLCSENLNCERLIAKLPAYLKKSYLNISVEYSSIDNRYKSDKRFFTSCPMGKYSKEDYINKLADPHMDSNGDLYLCGLVLKNKSFCIGNILEDTKEKIVSMIDDLAKKISKQKWKDCCPILNRNVEENRCLVCPIVYIKEGGLKL